MASKKAKKAMEERIDQLEAEVKAERKKMLQQEVLVEVTKEKLAACKKENKAHNDWWEDHREPLNYTEILEEAEEANERLWNRCKAAEDKYVALTKKCDYWKRTCLALMALEGENE